MTRHATFLLALALGASSTFAQQPAATGIPAPADVAPTAAETTAPTPAAAAAPEPAAAASEPASVLPGRPDADPLKAGDMLDAEYESKAHGITLRPPKGSTAIRRQGSQNVVEFVDDKRGWTLQVSKIVLPKPGSLTETRDAHGTVQPGVLEFTAKRLKEELPAAEMIRQDKINIAQADVGLLVLRFTQNLKSQLTQQAIIQRNAQIYYLLALTTPGAGKGGKDAAGAETERLAVETFQGVLDSVKLLDDADVRNDQNARLFRTRGLLVNITPDKLRQALISKQWTRIQKDGKDVGYAYYEEKTLVKGAQENLEIRTRSRVMPGNDVQNDVGSILHASVDLRHEDWSTVTQTSNAKARAAQKDYKPPQIAEFGVSDRRTVQGQGDVFSLQVIYEATDARNDPVVRELPPFYLPQAVSYLLPRLVPMGMDKTYMFAVYVPETREVMARYIDVHAPQKVEFNHQVVRATLVDDRIGLEGPVTTHYFAADHSWLGSSNKTTGITVLPSDEKTLLALWKDAILSAPDAPERPANAPAAQPAAPAADASGNSPDAQKPQNGQNATNDAKPANGGQPAIPRLGLKPGRR